MAIPRFHPVVNPLKTATISTFPELPGAVFFGDIFDEDIDYASRLQAIRNDYESTDCQATLWHELSQMGFGSREIEAAILNPAAITGCGYGLPYCGTSLPSALVAV